MSSEVKLHCWDHFFKDTTEVSLWCLTGCTPWVTAHIDLSTAGTSNAF